VTFGVNMKAMFSVIAAAVVLAGCQTTEQALQTARGKWIGRPADSFFVENGPPVSSFPRDTGGHIYTWRGGETSSVIPAQFQVQQGSTQSQWSHAGTGSSTTVTSPNAPSPTTVTYRPERRFNYVCEAQITTNAQGIIESVRISRDTDGVGFSFSRCSEVFAR
jgi:hypothetical protein